MAAQISLAFWIHWAMAFSAPWIIAAYREESNLQTAMKTGFTSCTCQKQVLEDNNLKMKEVILVTKKWDLGQCTSTCPGYCEQDGAPFVRCLEVHTATGNTGNQADLHFSMMVNMVPGAKFGKQQVPPLSRKESYMPENEFSACSCKITNTSHVFLFGQDTWMNGLKVWGRVGCPRSCGSECYKLNSISTGCIQAEMTEAKGQVGEVGYQRVPLVVSNAKQSSKFTAKVIHANEVQQKPTNKPTKDLENKLEPS